MVYIINMVEMEKNILSRFANLSVEMSLPQMKAGEVWIVGAGPGELGLLSLHGLNALQQADIVLHDSLVSPSLLALAGDAQTEYVGKRAGAGRSGASRKQTDISQRLIELSRAGKKVVRLKGGDPGIFGRSGEEAHALAGAGVSFRVFAGVSAALAAAHAAEVSLTHRERNHSVSFITGHDAGLINWQALCDGARTLVIYMPQDYAAIQARLLGAGRAPSESIVIVSHAGLAPKEAIIKTTLSELDKNVAEPPSIIIVGAKGWE